MGVRDRSEAGASGGVLPRVRGGDGHGRRVRGVLGAGREGAAWWAVTAGRGVAGTLDADLLDLDEAALIIEARAACEPCGPRSREGWYSEWGPTARRREARRCKIQALLLIRWGCESRAHGFRARAAEQEATADRQEADPGYLAARLW